MKVLLIDDDRFVRTAFSLALRDLGVEVSCAIHGADALRILEKESFDLILCDINMPVMDGLEFGYHLRQDSRFDDVPLVLITGARTRELEEAFVELKVSEVLWKPIGLETMRSMVERFKKNEISAGF